ncbi:MAG: type II secretion system protein [Candidatus Woesebacteria bacterium]|nr:type II secretion system protein [Candidatus Woesebacteria bacterium]
MKKGFTLIELLVVISIIGILLGLSVFGLQGARQSARDARRKADLESIRSGLEIYKADCNNNNYPVNTPAGTLSSPLVGTVVACGNTNTYIASVPVDPIAGQGYVYYSADGTTYELCASLEQGTGTVTCGASGACGTGTCNYKVINP